MPSLPGVRRLFVGKKFSADSGKLPLISDSRFHHVTKPDSFASGTAGKLAARYLYGLLVRAHVPELRHVLQADGIRRRTDLPSHSGSDLGNPDGERCKVNFDSQLEKFEEAIPAADDYDLYGVYPAIDACVALSELMHSRLSGETLEHAIEVSKTSITTVAMLEMTQAGREMTDEELKTNPAVEQEWDIQWEIFRLLADCEERDIELIKGLRADLREAGESNIGINFQQ